MRRSSLRIALIVSCCVLEGALVGQEQEKKARASVPRVWFNQQAIEGAWSELDAGDPVAVFRLVFSQLDDEVTVYPTENYYYFQFQARGKTYWGNLRLDALDRDRGIVHLGYFQFNESGLSKDMAGKGRPFSAADGVYVTRVDPWRYDVRFAGRTVRFRLHDPGFGPPRRAKLRRQELYVGPIFDESGLPFALLFDRGNRRFLYVLDEDRAVPETFVRYDNRVVVGQRTGFAFYDDARHDRKVLVAVHAFNADRNSYYDGPFDQLPDNYVERTRIKRLLEAAYPFTKDQIDAFGHYLRSAGSERVAIWAYAVYTTLKDLDFVASCAGVSRSDDELYPCIAPDPQATGGNPRQPEKVGEISIEGTVDD
jgi:hypothetical protein